MDKTKIYKNHTPTLATTDSNNFDTISHHKVYNLQMSVYNW